MRLILVRHGQSPSNIDHLIDTSVPGPPLTTLGLAQAAALPAALSGEQVDAIYASSMLRAQMTAAPLAEARGLTLLVRDGIREVTAGDLEMAGDDASIEAYLTIVFAWAAGDLARRMPGGETGAETFARYDAVVAEAAASASGSVVMVSHGAAIRMWVAGRAGNLPPGFAATNPLENTGVVILDGDPSDGWRLVAWTDRIVGGVAVPTADGPGGQPLERA